MAVLVVNHTGKQMQTGALRDVTQAVSNRQTVFLSDQQVTVTAPARRTASVLHLNALLLGTRRELSFLPSASSFGIEL